MPCLVLGWTAFPISHAAFFCSFRSPTRASGACLCRLPGACVLVTLVKRRHVRRVALAVFNSQRSTPPGAGMSEAYSCLFLIKSPSL